MRISIITITYNSAKTLRDTLESVAYQDYGDIEHIVVDGGSSDDTLAIVQQYPHIEKCLVGRDKGIYDALNKGINAATGDYIGILHSDDFYADDAVISRVVRHLQRTQTDALYADLDYVYHYDVNVVVRAWRSGNFDRHKFYFGWMPPHPTFFLKKSVYEQLGGYSLELKSAADYELMLRVLFKYDTSVAYLPSVIIKMRTGGMSNRNIQNRIKANLEDRKAWTMNGLEPYFFTSWLKPFSKLRQFVLRYFFYRLLTWRSRYNQKRGKLLIPEHQLQAFPSKVVFIGDAANQSQNTKNNNLVSVSEAQ
ncbi:MAG TPA: glycosyl transferase [Chitinophagaceae bacterium]|nr:glycosyl transferase [Chitinophagaceae bacterium]